MRHPYTRGLLAAIPTMGADKTTRPLTGIPGQLPPPLTRPKGCVFGPRCGWFAAGRCDATPIEMEAVGSRESEHLTRCARVDAIDWDTPPVAAIPVGTATARGDLLLEVNNLTKRYRHVVANDGLTFDVHRGETVAIVGESGCGKSTFARILTGLAEATSGSITLEGLELSQLPVSRRSRATIRSLQMVFQNPFDTLNPAPHRRFADRAGHPQVRCRT